MSQDAFAYTNNELHVEELPLAELAGQFGTPLFVYSRGHMQRQYRALSAALGAVRPDLHYAVKANSNAAVIRLFADEGAGADIVSGGELFRARRAGVDPARMVFAGVGKTEPEIDEALRAEIRFFTVESEPELARLSARAVALDRTARVAVRVNPDVDPRTHRYTSTGKKESKFGVDLERAMMVFEQAAALPGIEIAGLHMHIGSPVMEVAPFARALEKVAPYCRMLQARYPSFRCLDIGGGLGIPYREDEAEFDLHGFAEAVTPTLLDLGLEVALEPGRYLTGNGGLLLCRVQYVKVNAFKRFVVVDAAMNDLIRPALYQAYHAVRAVRPREGTCFGDLVGPVCESGDFLAAERELPVVEQDDLLAVMSAGAYGFTMASTYNSRPSAAEVMVSSRRAELVRERGRHEDLVRGEILPDW